MQAQRTYTVLCGMKEVKEHTYTQRKGISVKKTFASSVNYQEMLQQLKSMFSVDHDNCSLIDAKNNAVPVDITVGEYYKRQHQLYVGCTRIYLAVREFWRCEKPGSLDLIKNGVIAKEASVQHSHNDVSSICQPEDGVPVLNDVKLHIFMTTINKKYRLVSVQLGEYYIVPHEDIDAFDEFKYTGMENCFLRCPALTYYLNKVMAVKNANIQQIANGDVWKLPCSIADQYKSWYNKLIHV